MTDPAADSTTLLDRLRGVGGDDLSEIFVERGEVVALGRADRLPELLARLRDDEAVALDWLVDLTAVDRLGSEPRFEIVLHLASRVHEHRVRIRAPLANGALARSVASVHPVADWLEREVHDLFGLGFERHPDLHRILREDETPGYPLRRDGCTGRRPGLKGRWP